LFAPTATLETFNDLYRLLDRARPAGAVTPVPAGNAPPRIFEDLNRIGALQPGWDTYGGSPISVTTLQQSVRVILNVYRTAETLAFKLPEPRLFASGDGKVGLFWRNDKRGSDLEVIIGETTIAAVGSEGGEVYEAEVEADEPLDILTLVHRHIVAA